MGSFSRHMGRASDYTDSETITAEYDWERRERYAEATSCDTCGNCKHYMDDPELFREWDNVYSVRITDWGLCILDAPSFRLVHSGLPDCGSFERGE